MKKIVSLGLILGMLASNPVFADTRELEKEMRLAATIGDNETIEKLIESGADINSANSVGKTALMIAVEGDNLDSVVLLLSRGAKTNIRTDAGCTALTFAAENGHTGITAVGNQY